MLRPMLSHHECNRKGQERCHGRADELTTQIANPSIFEGLPSTTTYPFTHRPSPSWPETTKMGTMRTATKTTTMTTAQRRARGP